MKKKQEKENTKKNRIVAADLPAERLGLAGLALRKREGGYFGEIYRS